MNFTDEVSRLTGKRYKKVKPKQKLPDAIQLRLSRREAQLLHTIAHESRNVFAYLSTPTYRAEGRFCTVLMTRLVKELTKSMDI